MAEEMFTDFSMEDLQDAFIEEENDSTEDVEFKKDNNNSDESEDTDNEELNSSLTDKNDLEKELNEFREDGTEDVVENKTDSGGVPTDSGEKYSLLASALLEQGVLPSLTQEELKNIKSFDDIAEAFKAELRNNEYAGLNEHQKAYLKALESGMPEQEFKQSYNQVLDYQKLSETDLEENEELRIRLIKDDFISKGYSEEKAAKLAQRSVDIGEDLDDAKEALQVKKEAVKAELDNRIKQYEENLKSQAKATKEQQEKLKQAIFDEKFEIIPGIKNNKQFAQKVYDTITKPAGYLEDGRPYNSIFKARMEDPIGFEHKLAYLFNLTDGFKKFDSIINTAKSQSVKQLDEFLNKNTFIEGTGNVGKNDYEAGEMDSILNKLDKFL